MSQDYHHHPGSFSFSNGFERSQAEILQQIRRDKVPPPQLVAAGIQEEDNETSGMLSEMFKFQHSTFHMSLPNPSPTSTLQGFHGTPTGGGHFSHFTWAGNDGGTVNAAAGEGQALSLSLSSSLHHPDAAKAGEEFRITGDGTGMLFFGQGMASGSSEYPCKNNLNLSGGGAGGGGGVMDQPHHIHVGFGSSIGVINGFRNSKYVKAAQELLEEFCSVVRGHHQFNKSNKTGSLNPNSNPTTTSDDGGDASNNNNNTPPLSAADRIEHQRRKVKLLAMLDEVDRRYNRYCEQMQMVVNSFDLMMGFGAAVPYTALAQKAMSRHFRCLKDAVAAQLKHSCEMLGDKDGGASGLTKGETPRLKMLEQSLRQQRAFHQMGMMEPETWRPQRGLPERSVNTLRAWLFEHFLHPYPSDADKLMLARQTGLSRSQVSNWFINARVRLWKPMVEEMYQQEVKVDSENMDSPHSGEDTVAQTPTPNAFTNSPSTTTTTPPPPSAAAAEAAAITTGKRSEINAAPESDPSLLAINTTQCFSENLASKSTPFNANVTLPVAAAHSFPTTLHTSGKADIESTLMRFGTNAAGNVSLTLGLRHAGNLPDKNHFFG